ncbi:MAG: replication-associated recombination protein A, partial [Bacillota bacterium]
LLGLPEAQINLAHAATYIASAPKSNSSYMGLARAQEDLRARDCGDVPIHLRDAHYQGAARLGHGQGYSYAHDYPEHFVRQQYLPDVLVGRRYYVPTDNGSESEIKTRLERLWGRTNVD